MSLTTARLSTKQLLAIAAPALAALLWMAVAAAPAFGGVTASGGCVDDVTGAFFPNRVPSNCTANDVTFILVGLGTQTDGCVTNPSDTVAIRLRAILQNTTAQTRYDVGMYLATDGDPNSDGAKTGTCARASIDPLGATGVTTCGVGALDLDGPFSGVDLNVVGVPDGPYLSAETGGNNSTPDGCGDLFSQGNSGCDENGDGLWDDTVYEFPTAVAFPCRDIENDGFVNIPTCVTWGNQANEVHDNTGGDTCESQAEIVPGTKAKCRCEDTNTTIPLPRLSCSATCSPSRIQPGQSTSCSVTYTNAASCTPSPSTPERFRCGTAGFIRFKTDYDESNGTVSALSTTGTGGGGATSDDGSQVIWTPASAASTAGIIGPGQSATMNFTYNLNGGASNNLTLNFATTGFWSNTSSFSTEVAQTALTCGASITTPVTLASFATRIVDGATVIEWTTATEVGSVGFNLYEELADGWRRINEQPIRARGGESTAPQRYRLEAAKVSGGRLYLESLDVDGGKQLHGPFERQGAAGTRLSEREIDWPAVRLEAEKAKNSRKIELKAQPAQGAAWPKVDLEVEVDGIYRVSYEQLAAAGFDFAGAHTAHLALVSQGEPVAIRVQAGTNGKFGPGGFVEFYGQGLDTLYTATNVYRLRVDPARAKRVAVDRQAPSGAFAPYYMETVRVERDRDYSFGSPTDDPWYDTRLLTFTSPGQWNFDLEVDGYLAGAAAPRLEVEMWGSTSWAADPDHHVRVALNGVALADDLFDGRTAHTVAVELPPGLLQEGTNTLTLELPGDRGVAFDLINLESFAVTYPRAFTARDGGLSFSTAGARVRVGGLPSPDVVAYRLTDGRPQWLERALTEAEGAGYAVQLPGARAEARYVVATPGALRVPTLVPARPAADITSGSAEYLIVSHPAFLGSLGPLVTHHQSRGLAVRVVDLFDVYDQFGHGILDPEAIRAYLGHAARAMGARYALLVGGDSYDYRDYLGIGSVSFVPTFYAATGNLIQFAPADALFADLDGDGVSDLPIGRLPVRTPAELEALIARTIEYAGKDYPRTAVFAADAFDASVGASFTRQSEELRQAIGAGWTSELAYLDSIDVGEARNRLLGSIDQGVAMTSFVGHSGPYLWTFSGLLTRSDVEGLGNASRPTVVVQWGCWNAYHVEPRFDTLGHAFLLSGDRGAAAVLGSATLLETASAAALAERLAPLLARPGLSVGEALIAAKQALAADHPELLDALLGFTILGDPALVIEP